MALPAFRTESRVLTGDPQQHATPVLARRRLGRGGLGGEQVPAQVQIPFAPAVSKQSAVTYAHETMGKDVQQEAAEEFLGRESHLPDLASLFVVFVGEGDLIFVQTDETAVGQGDPVGVAGQVPEHLLRASKGRLAIDHPDFAVEAVEPVLEEKRIAQGFGRSRQVQSPLSIDLLETERDLPRNIRVSTRTGRRNLSAPAIHLSRS